jgi:hypothetical protein
MLLGRGLKEVPIMMSCQRCRERTSNIIDDAKRDISWQVLGQMMPFFYKIHSRKAIKSTNMHDGVVQALLQPKKRGQGS